MVSIYRTNRPVETMGYPGFDFKNKGRSFVPAKDVLDFLEDYTQHYNVYPRIKFEHHVVRVLPTDDGKWEVKDSQSFCHILNDI